MKCISIENNVNHDLYMDILNFDFHTFHFKWVMVYLYHKVSRIFKKTKQNRSINFLDDWLTYLYIYRELSCELSYV